MQIDVDWPSTGESVRGKNGWEYAAVRDFFCGGFAHLSPTPGGKAHIKTFLETIGAHGAG